MNRIDKSCRLCRALNNPFVDGELRLCDTILFQSQHFVLLPAIGPLVLGHAMVVSREHYPSLAAMPPEVLAEYESIVDIFYDLPGLAANLLEAEHGSTTDCLAGSCVSHTHIHLLPGLSQYSSIFEHKLPAILSVKNLADIHGLKEPYILLRSDLDEHHLYHASSAPAQAIRREICDRLGQANWDWRLDPRTAMIEETVTFWRDNLSHVKAP